MSAERKAMWRKDIDLLLSVADYIVELVPSQQTAKDGTTMEVKIQLSRTHVTQKTKKTKTHFAPHLDLGLAHYTLYCFLAE